MKPQNNDFNSYIYILYYQNLPNGGLGGETTALNAMAICDQRHANVSKQVTISEAGDSVPLNRVMYFYTNLNPAEP